MKLRNLGWITSLLVLALLQFSVTVHGKKSSTEKDTAGRKSDDLEASESSYNIYSYKNGYSSPASYYRSSSPSGFGFGSGSNVTCGDTFSNQCQNSRYRTYDGSCNNLHHPAWGMANTRYGRLVPASYSDGLKEPARSLTGQELPPSRLVSFVLFPHADIDDPIWTLIAMQYGQIITHDMGMAAGTTQAKAHSTQCCLNGRLLDKSQVHSSCYPIVVPHGDPVYEKANIDCLNFVRTTTDLDSGCSLKYKHVEQLTAVSHHLDLSLVYGSSDQVANSLRAGVAGRLRTEIRRNKEWLPSASNKSATCDLEDNQNEVCYQAGDVRVNQNPQLTILHILLHREHNRIAVELAKINPHWNDETIFQEARRINIAQHQHISYDEWLPIFLGENNLQKNKIIYETDDYVNDYNPSIDPSVLNEHSTAAFRYFHSLIAGFLNLVTENRSTNGALRLSNFLNRPGIIERGNNMDDLTRGMAYQLEKASDRFFDREITQFLFRNGRRLGNDLRAIDIQRNRDHGLASYNDYRQYCGLPRAKSWNDFLDWISAKNVDTLSRLYSYPDDVDLTVGGSLETHVAGTLSGPTFLCIMTEQFYRTRVGDRFWFESGNHELAFTIEQLNEIRKSSISRLLCDNGDDIKLMQPRGFEQVSERNPLRSCNDLPAVNLLLWKDFAPELAKQAQNFNHIPLFKKK